MKKLLLKLLEVNTSTYTTSSLSHVASASVTVVRVGKLGYVYYSAKNTGSALAVGSEASFVCGGMPDLDSTFSGFRGSGWSGSSFLPVYVNQEKKFTLRVIGAQWVANYDVGGSLWVMFK